jgi:hypothetical protein
MKSISINALVFFMALTLLTLTLKAQSVEETSWSRSARPGYYSETLTFYKNGTVKLFKVFKGKKSIRTGTYLRQEQFLELKFPATRREIKWSPYYQIENNRLLPKNKLMGPGPKDMDLFKLVSK